MLNYYSKKELTLFLNKRGIHLTKRHGQNLLLDKNILNKIANSPSFEEGDHVFEIGGGLGHLTAFLAAKGVFVSVFEIDKKLAQCLRERFADSPNVKVIGLDFLSCSFADYIDKGKKVFVVGNIPYNITSPIITHCLENTLFIRSVIIMVQKDFAMRVISSPSSKTYGSLSVFCQTYSKPSILFNVSRSVFYPTPTVDSSVLLLDIDKSSRESIKDEKLFSLVLKSLFNKRRKTIFNTLRNSAFVSFTQDAILDALAKSDIPPSTRAENLDYNKIIYLSNILVAYK